MNYTHYFKHISSSGLIVLMSLLTNCGQTEEHVIINVSVKYINKTSDTITISGRCGFNELNDLGGSLKILRGDSIILHQTDRIYEKPKPDINNIDLITGGSCLVIYGDSIKCDYGYTSGVGDSGFWHILNYEKRKKSNKNTFEFTYRFTVETKNAASNCQ